MKDNEIFFGDYAPPLPRLHQKTFFFEEFDTADLNSLNLCYACGLPLEVNNQVLNEILKAKGFPGLTPYLNV